MRLGIIVALAFFWVAMAWRAFQRGDTALGAIFIVAGVALTIHRLGKLSN